MNEELNKLSAKMQPLNMADVTALFSKQIIEEQNKIFEYALRNEAFPPIKGEITKGKIKWRGIRIVTTNHFLENKTWLEQRGKRISPVIEIKSTLPSF